MIRKVKTEQVVSIIKGYTADGWQVAAMTTVTDYGVYPKSTPTEAVIIVFERKVQ